MNSLTADTMQLGKQSNHNVQVAIQSLCALSVHLHLGEEGNQIIRNITDGNCALCQAR